MLLLKEEFVETVCRLYMEKNQPELLRDIVEIEEAMDGRKRSFIVREVLRQRSFYDVLNTQEGFLTL